MFCQETQMPRHYPGNEANLETTFAKVKYQKQDENDVNRKSDWENMGTEIVSG